MKINWKVRFRNPHFVAQIILAVLLPIITFMGLTVQDLTTWSTLGGVLFEGVRNPYVLGLVSVSVYSAVNDPTTKGLSDSKQALTYQKPRNDK